MTLLIAQPRAVSVLYREPKLLKGKFFELYDRWSHVSVLYREPKLLKDIPRLLHRLSRQQVSVLYREPKLLKASG